MSEANTWKWLKPSLKKGPLAGLLQLHRLENPCEASMPDTYGHLKYCSSFWMELKWAPRPKREGTLIRTRSPMKPGQVDWLEEHWDLEGQAWVLLQIDNATDREFFLIPGRYAEQVADGMSWDWLYRYCYRFEARAKPWDLLKVAAVARIPAPR